MAVRGRIGVRAVGTALLATALAVAATARAEDLWSRCAAPLGEEVATPPPTRHIGDGAVMQDLLLKLILAGEKTITTTSPWLFEAGLAREPRPGEYTLLLDGTGRTRAVLRTTQVKTIPFDQVTAEDSQYEGESVRPLAAWREVHVRYFTRHLAALEREFSVTMPVTLERFEVVCRDESAA